MSDQHAHDLILLDERALAVLDDAPAGSDGARVEDVLDAWLQNQRSEETVRAYASDWRDFSRWCSAHGIASVSGVSLRLLVEYRKHLRDERGLAAATIARRLAAIRQGLDAAVFAKLLDVNPAKQVKAYPVPTESPRVALSEEQVRALLAQPDRATLLGARDYAILMLGVFLGPRRSEIAHLRCGSIYTERSHYAVRIEGKRGKTRILPIPPVVMQAVRDYLEMDGRLDAPTRAPEQALFRPTENDRVRGDIDHAMSAKDVRRVVARYATRAGLGDHPHLDAHTLRVSAITNALEHGAKLDKAQDMAGHADPRTTRRYDKRRLNLDESAVYDVKW